MAGVALGSLATLSPLLGIAGGASLGVVRAIRFGHARAFYVVCLPTGESAMVPASVAHLGVDMEVSPSLANHGEGIR